MLTLRRVLTVVVASSVAFVSLAFQTTGAAAGGGSLFAITGLNQRFVSRIDPVAGTIAPITGDLSGPNQGQTGTITGNPTTHRIFTVRTTFSFDNNGNFLLTNEVLTIDELISDAQCLMPPYS